MVRQADTNIYYSGKSDIYKIVGPPSKSLFSSLATISGPPLCRYASDVNYINACMSSVTDTWLFCAVLSGRNYVDFPVIQTPGRALKRERVRLSVQIITTHFAIFQLMPWLHVK